MEVETRGWIELAFYPYVTEQAVNNARHAAKERIGDLKLREIRQDRDDDDQTEQFPGTFPSLDHAAKVKKPNHVEEDVQEAEVHESGSDEAPNLSVHDFGHRAAPLNSVACFQHGSDQKRIEHFKIFAEAGNRGHGNAGHDEQQGHRPDPIWGRGL